MEMKPNSCIPLFDSLAHPTLNGLWMKDMPSSFDEYIIQMKNSNVKWAFAVGMKNLGGYDEQDYLIAVEAHVNLFPVAYFDYNKVPTPAIKQYLLKLKELGYFGIKLHPRYSNFSITDEKLYLIIQYSNELGLLPFLCTYFYSNFQQTTINRIDDLCTLLKNIHGSRIVFLHGGGVRVIEVMEIVRFNRNVLLDLSLTMCKYRGSSVESDVRYIFKNFYRQTCIGSDYPEHRLSLVRELFDEYSKPLGIEAQERIAYRNICEFAGIALS